MPSGHFITGTRKVSDRPGARGCVLFVDDEPQNLVVWEAACVDHFRVLTADSGPQALEHMGRHEVAVVLADQRMPGMTGVELLAEIRERHPEAIRMLITAYSDLGAAVDAINRGNVRRYLRKPCALPELRTEIAEALDLYGLRQRVRAADRRLVLTERVYALGVVAAGLGREMARPTAWIEESVSGARAELRQLVARLDQAQANPRVVQAKLAEIETTLGRALHGVERVRDIARSVELPTGPEAPGRVDLAEVLRLALKVVRDELRRGTDVQLDLETVPAVRGTVGKLTQVALNLLVNSIDAVSHLSPPERSVAVRLTEQSGTVRLDLIDNGASIPEEDLPHLFDPLHTGSSLRGTGLGLAISRAILDELGGSIDVANRPGGGVLSRVILPAAVDALVDAG